VRAAFISSVPVSMHSTICWMPESPKCIGGFRMERSGLGAVLMFLFDANFWTWNAIKYKNINGLNTSCTFVWDQCTGLLAKNDKESNRHRWCQDNVGLPLVLLENPAPVPAKRVLGPASIHKKNPGLTSPTWPLSIRSNHQRSTFETGCSEEVRHYNHGFIFGEFSFQLIIRQL
jgi:hypothetical protein